jgi:hypothetical protein
VNLHGPGLGSFSSPDAPRTPGTETCRRCGETALTRIRMQTPTGISAVFVACPSCELTGWFAIGGTGEPMTLDEVGTGPTTGGTLEP